MNTMPNHSQINQHLNQRVTEWHCKIVIVPKNNNENSRELFILFCVHCWIDFGLREAINLVCIVISCELHEFNSLGAIAVRV